MKYLYLSSLLCLIALTITFADTLETSSGTFQGAFESFEKDNFMFRLESGELIKKPRIAVRKLAIASPREADFTYSAKRDAQKYTLHGYEKGKFTISKDNKQADLMAMHVSKISISAFAPPSRGDDNGGEQTQSAKIDLSILEGKELSPTQSAIITSYKNAATKYKEFLTKNSAMVKEMDSATGTRREQLLNELRLRKNQEQPLKNEYKASRAALLQEFPELLAPKTVATREESPAETITQTEIVITIPKLGENEVLFIDTSILNQAGEITDAQKAAMNRYDDAKSAYQTTVNGTGADRDALAADLKKAQNDLFKAFPTLKIVEQ